MTPVLAERAGVAPAFQRGASHDNYPAEYDGALIGAFRKGFDKAQRQDAANVQYRDRERRRLYAMWQRGTPPIAIIVRPVCADLRIACSLQGLSGPILSSGSTI